MISLNKALMLTITHLLAARGVTAGDQKCEGAPAACSLLSLVLCDHTVRLRRSSHTQVAKSLAISRESFAARTLRLSSDDREGGARLQLACHLVLLL
jgi:hypothetical protein